MLHVYIELFHTERAHVRNLKVMQHLFYRPMNDDQAIPADFVTLLFPNIDDMIELHGESVASLHVFHGLAYNSEVKKIKNYKSLITFAVA